MKYIVQKIVDLLMSFIRKYIFEEKVEKISKRIKIKKKESNNAVDKASNSYNEFKSEYSKYVKRRDK